MLKYTYLQSVPFFISKLFLILLFCILLKYVPLVFSAHKILKMCSYCNEAIRATMYVSYAYILCVINLQLC